jgi:hypothetical protein
MGNCYTAVPSDFRNRFPESDPRNPGLQRSAYIQVIPFLLLFFDNPDPGSPSASASDSGGIPGMHLEGNGHLDGNGLEHDPVH